MAAALAVRISAIVVTVLLAHSIVVGVCWCLEFVGLYAYSIVVGMSLCLEIVVWYAHSIVDEYCWTVAFPDASGHFVDGCLALTVFVAAGYSIALVGHLCDFVCFGDGVFCSIGVALRRQSLCSVYCPVCMIYPHDRSMVFCDCVNDLGWRFHKCFLFA